MGTMKCYYVTNVYQSPKILRNLRDSYPHADRLFHVATASYIPSRKTEGFQESDVTGDTNLPLLLTG